MMMLARQLHDLHVRQSVDRVGRFVEDQQVRIEQQGAGDTDALPLAARQVDAVRADGRVVTLRQRGDEAIRARRARRRFDFGERGVGPAVSDILRDGAGDEIAVLAGNRDAPPPVGRIDRIYGLVAEANSRPIPDRPAGTTG